MNRYSLSVTEEVSDELGVCVIKTEVHTFATSLFPKRLWQQPLKKDYSLTYINSYCVSFLSSVTRGYYFIWQLCLYSAARIVGWVAERRLQINKLTKNGCRKLSDETVLLLLLLTLQTWVGLDLFNDSIPLLSILDLRPPTNNFHPL